MQSIKRSLSYTYGSGSMALIFILLLAIGPMQASAASLTVEKPTVCEGSWVNASFILPYAEDQPEGELDDGGYGFAAFFEKDARNDGWVGGTKYFNNGEGKEVKMSFRAPHKLGQYEFRLFRDPYNQKKLGSKPVDIQKCPASGAYVDTPKTVCLGQSANITAWLPIEEDDRFDGSGFVALYRAGTDEQIGGTRSGVNDNCMSNCAPKPVKFPLTFQIPPGDYEWRMFGDYFGQFPLDTYPVKVIDCAGSNPQNGAQQNETQQDGNLPGASQQTPNTGIPAPACDGLILNLNEGPNSAVIAKVVDACEHKPLEGAALDIRIFHTWDEQLKKAINGNYADIGKERTNGNGEVIIPVTGNPGDIYRVDVYASKEGWDTSDRSIHITIGGGGGTESDRAGISFNGAWNTDWGILTLIQKGESVDGGYTHDSGMIEGIVIGNVLKGKWSEAPTYKPPSDAGDFEFQLDPDGKSFTGKWRYGSSGEWNSWNGKLMEER